MAKSHRWLSPAAMVLAFCVQAGAHGQGLFCTARDEIGHIDVMGMATGVGLYEHYLIVSQEAPDRVFVYDILDPTSPQLVHTLDRQFTPSDIKAFGQYVHFLDDFGGPGLEIYDFEDPQAPVFVGRISGDAFDIAYHGQYAYLAQGSRGVAFFDLSDQSNPVQYLSLRYSVLGQVNSVELVGDYLYVTDIDYGVLRILDVSDPLTPEVIQEITIGDHASNMLLLDNLLYVLTSSRMITYNVSDPVNPVPVTDVPRPWPNGPMDLHNDLVYVPGYESGVWMFDVGNPYEPTLLHVFPTEVRILDIAVKDMVLAISDPYDGVSIYDYSKAPYTTTLAQPYTDSGVTTVTGLDGITLMMKAVGGLSVLDTSDPSSPVEIATLFIPNETAAIEVDGEIACIAARTQGVWILNIADPSNPTAVQQLGVSGAAVDVEIDDYLLYVAKDAAGIEIIDPILYPTKGSLGSIDTPGNAVGLDLVGDRLYVADDEEGLAIFDVSDRLNPVHIGTSAIPWFARDVKVVGDIAWIANGEKGLRGLDISDPTQITQVGKFDPYRDQGYERLEIVGDLAYVADNVWGMHVIDISDPANPWRVASYKIDGGVDDLSIEGNIAKVASRVSGLHIVDLSDCPEPCPGDVNGDGELNPDDFTAWVAAFNTQSPACDQNGDGLCEPADFTAWLANFNAGCP